jgi:adenosylcobinamide-phosphate synthase
VKRAAAIAAGLVADRLLGEPPTAWHPIAWFGSVMGHLEPRIHADRRRNGVAYTTAGVALGVGAGLAMRRITGPTAATAVATGLAVAGRMLDEEATRIGDRLLAGDLEGARGALRSLVGRSPDDLDEASVSRAVIESVAENSVDAVTAAAFWALVGGAPAVLAYRAINTMDAMVGHHNARYERFGWASARLDDLANWLPARLSALWVLTPLLARSPEPAALLRTVRRQASVHPSPNGGLIEAAYAHRLGVTLGGTNRYGTRDEHRGLLGDGPAAGPADIERAVTLRRRAAAQLTLALIALTLLRRGPRRRTTRR